MWSCPVEILEEKTCVWKWILYCTLNMWMTNHLVTPGGTSYATVHCKVRFDFQSKRSVWYFVSWLTVQSTTIFCNKGVLKRFHLTILHLGHGVCSILKWMCNLSELKGEAYLISKSVELAQLSIPVSQKCKSKSKDHFASIITSEILYFPTSCLKITKNLTIWQFSKISDELGIRYLCNIFE